MEPKGWDNLVEVVQDRAHRSPAEPAYSFLSGDHKEETLTLEQLDRRARALAGAIQQRGLAGRNILLLTPPGLDFVVGFWGCLYAKAVAVPTYPPDQKQLGRTLPRLTGVARDCGAAAILSTPEIELTARPILEHALGIRDLIWLTTETDEREGGWSPPKIAREDLAFLQYTSGSTGEPKGVMVSHGNLLENANTIASTMNVHAGMRGVLWLPPYHDMGLIGGIIQPMVSSLSILLMSPLDFITRPLRWLNLISSRRLEASGGPNFAYDLCARRITPKQKAALDLSCWKLAFTGAEPVRSSTLRRFVAEFAECGFRPEAFYTCYGLAEATLFVSGAERGKEPSVRLLDRDRIGRGEVAETSSLPSLEIVGAGRPGDGIELRIVDPETHEACQPDRVGEIWVAGPSVGQGYWGRALESCQTFRARLRGQKQGPDFLRTGDLGFLRGGEVFVVGRIKDMVIVNGANYYPQDIEAIADQAHEAIRIGSTAAISIDRPEGEVLGIVAEAHSDRRAELEEVAAAIRSKVTAAIGIAPEVIALIPRRTLPKTPSGKVCRNATRKALMDGSLPTYSVFDARKARDEPEMNERDAARQQRSALARLGAEERQQALTALVMEAISEVKPSAVGEAEPDTPVARLGLDSIHVVELLAELEERSGVVLPMEELVRGTTIRELVQAICRELDREGTGEVATA